MGRRKGSKNKKGAKGKATPQPVQTSSRDSNGILHIAFSSGKVNQKSVKLPKNTVSKKNKGTSQFSSVRQEGF
jgi:hypothetical protein